MFVDWAKDRGFVGSYEELCQNPVGLILEYNFHLIKVLTAGLNGNWFCLQQDVKKAVLEDMNAVGREARLNSFEQVSKLIEVQTHKLQSGWT